MRFIPKRSKKAGLPPGTIVHQGRKVAKETKISVFQYDEKDCQEFTISSLEEISDKKYDSGVSWINIDGLNDTTLIENIGKKFNIHSLVMEDIVNTYQRPKCEDQENYLFIVLKMLSYEDKDKVIKSEQVSFILMPNCLVTFQEHEGDVFDPVRNRIREQRGKIRTVGVDYLTYALVDSIVDNYFVILEKIGDAIEEIEVEIEKNQTQNLMKSIFSVKKDIIILRKAVWPLRDLLSAMSRNESNLLADTTNIYIRDVYDHIIQITDSIDLARDLIAGFHDTYLSLVSNKMNEVMKVLTIIATIFIPLTFIAGIYGMNFEYMPELKWRWGYFANLILMIVIAAGMVLFFKKKKWL